MAMYVCDMCVGDRARARERERERFSSCSVRGAYDVGRYISRDRPTGRPTACPYVRICPIDRRADRSIDVDRGCARRAKDVAHR